MMRRMTVLEFEPTPIPDTLSATMTVTVANRSQLSGLLAALESRPLASVVASRSPGSDAFTVAISVNVADDDMHRALAAYVDVITALRQQR